jgi:periplasmic mercuric ion binding protein
MEKMMKKLTFLCLIMLTSLSAFAKPQTVTLDVPTMNCATCPFTVNRALKNVDGVIDANASLETKSAIVTFDDEKVSAERLVEATTNAGYPSSIKK